MSLVRFRSKALGYDNCSYSSAFHEFQKTLKSACNLGKPVVRYEMSERQQFNMREWLSWWSTTLPRSGSRVRVPSRALNSTRKGIRNGYPFLYCSSPAGLERSRSPLCSGRCKANVHWTFCNVSRSQEYGFRVIRDPLFVCVNEITESFYLKTPRGCNLWGFCFAIWKFSHSLVAYIIFYFCHVVNMS